MQMGSTKYLIKLQSYSSVKIKIDKLKAFWYDIVHSVRHSREIYIKDDIALTTND